MHYCSQEKGSGALLFVGKRNWCTTVLREKESGALMLSAEGNWCYTVFRIRIWCSIVFRRRKLVHYCYQRE